MIIEDPHKKVITERPLITDIVCNQCGGSCLKRMDKGDEGELYGLAAEFCTGFLSTDFPDGQIHRFHLCEKCLCKLEAGFVHPPEVIENSPPSEAQWEGVGSGSKRATQR